MKFKIDYLNKKKILKFLIKNKHIELLLLENITYASLGRIGASNPIRSKDKMYNINRIPSLIESTGFNNNMVTRTIVLKGDGVLSYKLYHLAYLEDGIVNLLKNYIKQLIHDYKYSISISDNNSLLIKGKKCKLYKLEKCSENNECCVAYKGNIPISKIIYRLEHHVTTEKRIGYYTLILEQIDYIKKYKESLFYIISEVIEKNININLLVIKIPEMIKNNSYLKYIFHNKFKEYEIEYCR